MELNSVPSDTAAFNWLSKLKAADFTVLRYTVGLIPPGRGVGGGVSGGDFAALDFSPVHGPMWNWMGLILSDAPGSALMHMILPSCAFGG
jgi:hypothetical protein